MGQQRVEVWDLPVRVFHWALAGLIAFSWWSGEEGGLTLQYHQWSGYAVLALVLFRLIWGFVGGEYARFATFVRGPRAVLAAARRLFDARPLDDVGHNPVGGWMVVALLVCLLVQTGTGLFANDDILTEGPLYKWVSKDTSDFLTGVHETNFLVLGALVAVHVLAIVWHRVRKGESLAPAMITGRKPVPPGTPAPRRASLWRALAALALCAGGVAALVNL